MDKHGKPSQSTPSAIPQLAQPGAGLPLFEKIFARYFIVNRLPYKMTWEDTNALFQREGKRILEIFQGLSDDKKTNPILIDRIQGIEDSSRFWSPTMVVEHLIIVGTGMSEAIQMLSKGQHPTFVADVAKVKPTTNLAPEIAEKSFLEFLENTQVAMQNLVSDRESKITFKHPWFGGLTARQWHWLMAAHQRIHRKQLQLIVSNFET